MTEATPRVMFLGDAHANLAFMLAAIDMCQKVEAQAIVQVGDFSVWTHTSQGVRFLEETEAALDATGIIIVFVDGNHENFTHLLAYPVDDDGFRRVRPHIWHAPRNHLWSWEGVRFGAMGGAHSIDAPPEFGGIWMANRNNSPGVGWWPQETIDDADVSRALSLARHPSKGTGPLVDIMVAHDVPLSVQIPKIGGYPMGNENRARLETIAKAWRPQLMVCGHYHERHTAQMRNGDILTRVEILSRDGKPGSYLLCDLDPFRLVLDSAGQS